MRSAALIVVGLAGCGDNVLRPPEPFCDAWHQWGNNAAHDGASCAAGHKLDRLRADIVIDPFAAEEEGKPGGDLVIHYQSPLLDDDSVYMMTKKGTFTPCLPQPDPMKSPCFQPEELYRLNTEVWTEVRYAWQGDALVATWAFDSDWKPEPGNFFEPMFQPALIDDRIAIPGAGGSVWELDAKSGAVVRHVTPFGADPDTYVAGPLAVLAGTIYYNAIKLDHAQPFDQRAASWLVAVRADGSAVTRSYADLVPDAPDSCYGVYPKTTPRPWPPLDSHGKPVLSPTYPCGPQQPGINSAPTFRFDGTIFVVTHAQFANEYSYIVSVNPAELSANWAASLRGLVPEGCGLTIPFQDGDPSNLSACTDGAPIGINPATGQPMPATVDDDSSSTPVALPHGGVIYGALSYDNRSRGQLLHFDDDGHFAGRYGFGWDSTPAVISDAFGDRIVIKDNHYVNWADPVNGPPGPFFLTQLDASLSPIWQFQNTETNSCERQPDGTLSCTSDHPDGFEWCVNAPAVDRDGTVFANSEDGNIYAITAGGELRERFFLGKSLGAAYTPLAIDHAGRIYALNNGHMIVIGGD